MIKKCLFPAAGYGTRFLPATKSMPKEMMPIVNKPLIEYGVDEALVAGLNEICIVTGRGKRALEDHFDVNFELEQQIAGTLKENYLNDIRHLMEQCRFSYTRQIEMKGLGHAVLTGEVLIGDQPFAVVLADDLCINPEGDGVLSQMVSLYKQFRCSIVAVQEVPVKDVNKYGVVAGDLIRNDLYRITNMIEKPEPNQAPSNLAVIGRYILTPDIFDILRQIPPGKGGEIQLTDALLQQANKRGVLAYKYKGKRFDCGSVEGFVQATNFCYEKNINQSQKKFEKRDNIKAC